MMKGSDMVEHSAQYDIGTEALKMKKKTFKGTKDSLDGFKTWTGISLLYLEA